MEKTGMTKGQYDRALAYLSSHKFIDIRHWKFGGARMTHIRLLKRVPPPHEQGSGSPHGEGDRLPHEQGDLKQVNSNKKIQTDNTPKGGEEHLLSKKKKTGEEKNKGNFTLTSCKTVKDIYLVWAEAIITNKHEAHPPVWDDEDNAYAEGLLSVSNLRKSLPLVISNWPVFIKYLSNNGSEKDAGETPTKPSIKFVAKHADKIDGFITEAVEDGLSGYKTSKNGFGS